MAVRANARPALTVDRRADGVCSLANGPGALIGDMGSIARRLLEHKVGDFNDTPDSDPLAPLLKHTDQACTANAADPEASAARTSGTNRSIETRVAHLAAGADGHDAGGDQLAENHLDRHVPGLCREERLQRPAQRGSFDRPLPSGKQGDEMTKIDIAVIEAARRG